jgi:hypothetical protein
VVLVLMKTLKPRVFRKPQRWQLKGIAMKSIAILALALAGNVFAGDVAYKCIGADGSTFYRSHPCSSTSSSIAPVIGGAGGLAVVPGSVREQKIERSQACQLAREKWYRTLDGAQSRGHQIPQDYANKVQANISALCY